MKNYVDKWFSNPNLLLKSKEERTEVISRFLFPFVAHELQKHLNFSYLFHNYDVTSLVSFNHILEVSKALLKNEHVLLKACKHVTFL